MNFIKKLSCMAVIAWSMHHQISADQQTWNSSTRADYNYFNESDPIFDAHPQPTITYSNNYDRWTGLTTLTKTTQGSVNGVAQTITQTKISKKPSVWNLKNAGLATGAAVGIGAAAYYGLGSSAPAPKEEPVTLPQTPPTPPAPPASPATPPAPVLAPVQSEVPSISPAIDTPSQSSTPPTQNQPGENTKLQDDTQKLIENTEQNNGSSSWTSWATGAAAFGTGVLAAKSFLGTPKSNGDNLDRSGSKPKSNYGQSRNGQPSRPGSPVVRSRSNSADSQQSNSDQIIPDNQLTQNDRIFINKVLDQFPTFIEFQQARGAAQIENLDLEYSRLLPNIIKSFQDRDAQIALQATNNVVGSRTYFDEFDQAEIEEILRRYPSMRQLQQQLRLASEENKPVIQEAIEIFQERNNQQSSRPIVAPNNFASSAVKQPRSNSNNLPSGKIAAAGGGPRNRDIQAPHASSAAVQPTRPTSPKIIAQPTSPRTTSPVLSTPDNWEDASDTYIGQQLSNTASATSVGSSSAIRSDSPAMGDSWGTMSGSFGSMGSSGILVDAIDTAIAQAKEAIATEPSFEQQTLIIAQLYAQASDAQNPRQAIDKINEAFREENEFLRKWQYDYECIIGRTRQFSPEPEEGFDVITQTQQDRELRLAAHFYKMLTSNQPRLLEVLRRQRIEFMPYVRQAFFAAVKQGLAQQIRNGTIDLEQLERLLP